MNEMKMNGINEKNFYSFQQGSNPSPYWVFLLPRGFYFLYLLFSFLLGKFLFGGAGFFLFSLLSLLLYLVLDKLYGEGVLFSLLRVFGGVVVMVQARTVPVFAFSLLAVAYLFFLFRVSPVKKSELKKTLPYLLGKKRWQKGSFILSFLTLFLLLFSFPTARAESCVFWYSLKETPQVSFWDRHNLRVLISSFEGRVIESPKTKEQIKGCSSVFIVFSGHNENALGKALKVKAFLKKEKVPVKCVIVDSCYGEKIASLFSEDDCVVYSKGELPAFGFGPLYYFLDKPFLYEKVLSSFFKKAFPLLKEEGVKVDLVVKVEGRKFEIRGGDDVRGS